MSRLLLLLSLVAMSGAAHGFQPRDPWPASPPSLGAPVSWPSSDPFTPADAATAPAREAIGFLYTPPGSDRASPRSIPAVVMLHGAGGVLPAREHLYGRQLAALGVAALVVDSFGARRDLGAGFQERLLNTTETMALADAYAGLRFLAQRPEIDPRRVVLMGFSYGAMATMYGLFETAASRLAPGGERFAGHVAFYGPCIAEFEDPRTTGAPLLMLYGGGDALIVPERCHAFAEQARAGGSAVEIVDYPDAVHQWDGGQPRRPIGVLLGGCRLQVRADGTVRDRRTGLPMSGPILRRLILVTCIENTPYLIGADDAVRARSNRAVGAFLARVFAAR